MKTKVILGWVVLMCLALTLGMGCAKKKVESTPPPSDEATQQEIRAEEQAAMEQEEAARRAIMEAEAAAEAAREQQMLMDAVDELKSMIHFDFDKSELKPVSREILKRKAELMKAFPQLTLVIEGFCDNRGTFEYNLALGERRARSAYEFLVLLGVQPERMSIVSYGEEYPLDPANNETAWAKNRRDQFKISY